MNTKQNGQTPALDREQIIREATYQAALRGYYDTSEEAQKRNLLAISFTDMSYVESLPENVTHKFFVMVNSTGYIVSRLHDGTYQVEEHDELDQQREERDLRAAVLDYGVYFLSGTGAGYMPGEGDEARGRYIKELLEDERNYDYYGEEEELPASDKYPIVRDEPVTIAVGEGFVAGPAQPCVRQWFVQIGAANRCHVGLIGFRTDNHQPEFVGAPPDDF